MAPYIEVRSSNYEKDRGVHKEMYHSSQNRLNFHFSNPLRGLFSFHISSEIKSNLFQFVIALLIGLGLNYIYYENLSLHYLFIGGIQDWFSILQGFLNYGLGGGYDILYLIINGFFYFYLYSTSVRLAYSIVTNLNRKGTWWFLAGFALIYFVIFKYFPNVIY